MATDRAFPIVGIGASAGGLAAIKTLFEGLPADSGAAFVVVQHLDPHSKSLAAEILSRCTQMPVAQATDDLTIVPNHVYVIPPDTYLTLSGRSLKLDAAVLRHGLRMPVDVFLQSLAENRQQSAVAIILSGTGSDGSKGVQAIAELGGLVMAQTPETAEYDGMPRSAIATGKVNKVCTVEMMPDLLLRHLRHRGIGRVEQNRDLLATIVRDSNDAIMVIDIEGIIAAWNRGAEKMYGWSDAEAIGTSLLDLVPESELDLTRQLLGRVAQGKSPGTAESRRKTRDGREILVWLSITPLADDSGHVQAIAITERDITHQKQREEELLNARMRAESATEIKSRFLAAASHDLRQPLFSLTLFNDSLRKLVRDDPKISEIVELQKASLDNMRSLLNRLLDTVKLETGGLQVVRKDFQVLPLLEVVCNDFRAMAREKEIGLKCRAGADLSAYSDPDLLAQAMSNLVANAIRYSRSGNVEVTCVPEGEKQRLSVTDTGIGIPEDQINQIFDEFYQVNPETGSNRRGMGLGLSIVQRIAGLLDTRVVVHSKQGRGTTFTFTLPSGKPSAVPKVPVVGPVVVAQSDLAGISILLVEDDPAVRDLLRMLLVTQGIQVTVAESLPAAIASLENGIPDLIISDFHLGAEGNAPDFVRSVRQQTGSRIPALVLSGDMAVSLGDLDRACLLTKPTTGEALSIAIRELLRPSSKTPGSDCRSD